MLHKYSVVLKKDTWHHSHLTNLSTRYKLYTLSTFLWWGIHGIDTYDTLWLLAESYTKRAIDSYTYIFFNIWEKGETSHQLTKGQIQCQSIRITEFRMIMIENISRLNEMELKSEIVKSVIKAFCICKILHLGENHQ